MRVYALLQCTSGTFMTAMVLGQPPSWMLHHASTAAMLLAWWLTFCAPMDAYWRITNYIGEGFFHVARFFAAIASGHSITTWGADKVLFHAFHNNPSQIRQSVVISIACGLISTTGGGVLADMLNLTSNPSFCISKSPGFFSIDGGNSAVCHKVGRASVLAGFYVLVLMNSVVFSGAHGSDDAEIRDQKLNCHFVICLLQVLNWLWSLVYPEADMFAPVIASLKALLAVPTVIEPDTLIEEVHLGSDSRKAGSRLSVDGSKVGTTSTAEAGEGSGEHEDELNSSVSSRRTRRETRQKKER